MTLQSLCTAWLQWQCTGSSAMLTATVRNLKTQAGEARVSAGADRHTGGGQEQGCRDYSEAGRGVRHGQPD